MNNTIHINIALSLLLQFFTVYIFPQGPPCTTLLIPSNMANEVNIDQGSVSFSWINDDPVNIISNAFYFGTDPSELSLIGNLPGSMTSVNFNLLTFSTEYFWSVVPSDESGMAANCEIFSFTTEGPPSTPNPGCELAIAVTDGLTFSQGIDVESTGIALNGCGIGAMNAIWYVYIASCSGITTVSSQIDPNEPDTRVSVHSECNIQDCLAFNDDTGGDKTSLVSFPTTEGESYYIEWDDRWDAGAFDFEITCTPNSFGCTDPLACNFDTLANIDNGSCINIGDPCDDDDPQTTDDNIGTDCVCKGTVLIDCATDLNGDRTTDGEDFGIFLGNFDLDCIPLEICMTDFNGDGTTDGEDFGIFLGNFDLSCN